jgi:Pentapeptide repeats (8 copies)
MWEVAERHKASAGIMIGLAVIAVVIWLPKASFIQPGGTLTDAQRATAESDFRGHLIQALGGLVLILGAYFTWQTFGLNREGQTSERFSRAIEQLASRKLDVRLGGIYTLERIAAVSDTHYEPVVEVLTAFLREHARWGKDSPPLEPDVLGDPEPPGLRMDFQAAVSALGRRDRSRERPTYQLNLRVTDLRRSRLRRAHFEWAILVHSHFEESELSGIYLQYAALARAHFERAYLDGAHLQDATLPVAHLNRADLRGAHLERAWLVKADLSGADLTDATGLTPGQLNDAITTAGTTLPEYLLRTEDGRIVWSDSHSRESSA